MDIIKDNMYWESIVKIYNFQNRGLCDTLDGDLVIIHIILWGIWRTPLLNGELPHMIIQYTITQWK
jgi:hypothetical protein